MGATAELPVDVRIVSATHKDLAAEVQDGRFRQDLYYRLNVIQIRVPPLRERLDDLALICGAVLQRIAADAGVSPPPRLSPQALRHLARYAFPGNVRELENLLHRAVALSGGELIEPADLGLPEQLIIETAPGDLDALEDTIERVRQAPGRSGQQPRAAQRPGRLPGRRGAGHPGARAGAAPLQPHGGRRQPGPEPAADALPHGAPGCERGRPCGRARPLLMPATGASVCGWREGWWREARAIASPNFGPRPEGTAVTLAVVHSISLPPGEYGGLQIEQLFTNRLDWDAHPYFQQIRGAEVSAHFVVRRTGELLQFVSCDQRAWHAGVSVWNGVPNCNEYSIGIELEGLEGQAFERTRSTSAWRTS